MDVLIDRWQTMSDADNTPTIIEKNTDGAERERESDETEDRYMVTESNEKSGRERVVKNRLFKRER